MSEDLTFVIPAKNEGSNISYVLSEIRTYANNSKILLVVDSDNDSTLNYINQNQKFIKIVKNEKKGFGGAVISGLNLADTNYCCICTADGSSNVKDFITMKEILIRDKLDIIFGSRYENNSKSEDDTLLTKFGNYFFSLIGRIFFHTKFNDILYTFVVMDVKIIKNLNLTKEDFTICLELPLNVVKKEIKYDIFPTIEKKRIDGKKKVNIFFDGLKMFSYLVKRYLYRK